MDSKELKRKRLVPEWMKSPTKSPSKSPQSKSRAQRPNYPELPLKRSKQTLKPLGKTEEKMSNKLSPPSSYVQSFEQEFRGIEALSSHAAPTTSNSSSDSPQKSYTTSDIDEFVMTVEDLTRVAQEVIREEQNRRALSMKAGNSRKKDI